MHTYRENNKCADFLANLGCAQCTGISFNNAVLFPKLLRGFYRVDKMGIPNLRCKKWCLV